MKGTKYITALLLGGTLALQSCNDFLDTKPASSYSEELVWGSKSTADAFVLQTYGGIVSKYTDLRTEDQFTTNAVVRNGCPDEARELKDRYWNFGFGDFGNIRRCNVIIEKAAASTSLSDADKKALVAEGKMLRAMVYYYQAKHTGRVIWVDKVLDEKAEFNLPLLPSIKDSYAKIVQDLNDAIAGLPTSSIAGRLNKNAALALKSEVCLTAAAYTGIDTYYQEAIDAVDAITGYTLDNNFTTMFNQTGAYTSPEIIFALYRSKDNTNCENTPMQNMLPNQKNDNLNTQKCSPKFNKDLVFEAWLEHSPSQNLVDAYLVIDQATGKALPWNETSQFTNSTRKATINEVSDMTVNAKELTAESLAYITTDGSKLNELMYNNRDKRFYSTIVYDSCQFYNETVTLCKQGNLHRTANTGALGNSHMGLTNYLWRKGVYDVNWRVFVGVPTDYHYVIFRYGRALLNKAEALLCQAKTNATKLPLAVAAMNQTRTVHGGLPASTATTLADAWTDYKRERQADLAFEGDYYWSLLRWGKYGDEANSNRAPGGIIKELTVPATFVEISKDRKRMFIGNVGFNNDQRDFKVRRYLFPIPQGQIEANSALKDSDQNPEW